MESHVQDFEGELLAACSSEEEVDEISDYPNAYRGSATLSIREFL
ncbi:MAG: hypothetical protein QMB94_10405 [Phycisphaerales bacterium]